jgi:very-short-patch-repair endonuclease
MEEKLIKEIIGLKECAIRSLVSLTESPIERRFLLEFLKFIEESLLLKDIRDFNIIDGYTYIMECADEFCLSFTNKIIGLSINHTSSWVSVEVKSLDYLNVRQSNPTKRKIERIEAKPDQYIMKQRLDLYPQYPIQIKSRRYRLDFALLLHEENNEGSEIRKKIAIECDGYEYHSSPSQFNKDRERTRDLQSDDWTVFQYSGSDLNSNKLNFTKEFIRIYSTLGFSMEGLNENR